MGYFKALFSGWVNAMHTILTIAAIGIYMASDVGHKDLHIPSWLSLLVGAVAFVSVSYRIWHKEWLRAEAGQGLRDGLRARCDAIILAWKELADQYQNATHYTLPNPMDPGWVSYKKEVWPYKVGVLQGRTNALREDLVRAGKAVEEWNYAYMTVVQLLHAMEKYESAGS